jgi:acetyl esterase/lipase
MHGVRLRRAVRAGALFALLASIAQAQPAPSAPPSAIVPLWPQGAPPGPLAWTKPEIDEARPPLGEIVRNVAQPQLEVYLPAAKTATGAAMIVAPGGGFHMLSIANEGRDVARWLNSLGVAAVVLKYRLIPTGDDFPAPLFALLAHPATMQDAIAPLRPLDTADGEQAVRLVRANARKWGIAPDRVGMMGFSAGGAVTVWTIQQDHRDSRPDLAMAIYPGALPDPLAVPAAAPPLFVLVADDDRLAGADSKRLAAAWRARGAAAELQLYPSGGHGFGIAKRGAVTDDWPTRAEAWLRGQGWLRKREGRGG